MSVRGAIPNPAHHVLRYVLLACLVLAPACVAWCEESEYPGFRMEAPEGEAWRLVQQNARSLVWMKRVEMVDGSFLVAVLTGPAPRAFSDKAQFVAFVKQTKQSNPDPQRFRVHRNTLEEVTEPGRECVAYDTAIEDQAKKTDDGRSLILEVTGLSCLHPDDRSRFFDIQFSSRHPAGVDTRRSELDDGASFLENFRFRPPPADGDWALGDRPLEIPEDEST